MYTAKHFQSSTGSKIAPMIVIMITRFQPAELDLYSLNTVPL